MFDLLLPALFDLFYTLLLLVIQRLKTFVDELFHRSSFLSIFVFCHALQVITAVEETNQFYQLFTGVGCIW